MKTIFEQRKHTVNQLNFATALILQLHFNQIGLTKEIPYYLPKMADPAKLNCSYIKLIYSITQIF